MRLNLGCGKAPMAGWTNVDVHDGPGVDLLLDLDEERCLAPFATSSVDEVQALAVLEHLPHWERLMSEVARVTRPDAIVEILVPHRMNYAPFHVRFFDKHTFDPYRSDYRSWRYDLRREVHVYGSLEFSEPYFSLIRMWVERFYPFAWHVAKYVLGPRAYTLPLGRAKTLRVWLRRNATAWVSR